MNELERLVERRDQTNKARFDRYQRGGLLGQILDTSASEGDQVWGSKISNFVHSDYLGLSKHPEVIRSACIGAKQLGISTSMPRVVAQVQLSSKLERDLARLVHQEKAALFSSTTHVALDVLPMLAGKNGMLFVDAWAYPISLEGVYAAVRNGAGMMQFAHNDPAALERALRSHGHIRDKVIVCDGVYSAGGGKADLQEFSLLAERYGGLIYLDDAHGLGILGTEPRKNPPFGHGGGGTALFENIPAGNLVYVASLSKALGVPLAFAAGPAKFIEFLSRESKSFVHSSQPALPIVAAAIGALRVNQMEGDQLREKLAQQVKQFIHGFEQMGIQIAANGYFPIQSLYCQSANDALQAGMRLRKNGIWPLLQISPIDFPGGGALRFVISAKHSKTEIQGLHELTRFFTKRQAVRASF
jgi:8-amino-7-oxononanoate synthase